MENDTYHPYNRRIADLTEEDRPREKAISKGLQALTTTELIALLLGSGSQGESVIELSQRILHENDNKLTQLSRCTIQGLAKRFKGVGAAKATTLLAAIELGKRYAQESPAELPQVDTPERAFIIIKDICDLPHEEFWALYLNNSKRLIRRIKISQGGVSGTIVDVKLILRHAIEHLATAIVLAHNHPSGSLTPSREDDTLTNRLVAAAKLMDIAVVDHLILGGGTYYSYALDGKL